MAALPIKEKADELIQEGHGEVQVEQLPWVTGEQRERELTAAMV